MAIFINWIGASATPYTFEAYPAGTVFNTVSGVYIFCRETSPGSWEALYVGETESLYQRLTAGIAGHDGYHRARKAGMTHVAVHLVSGVPQRLRIETDLRHGLDPVANRQSIAGGFGNVFR